MQMVPQMELLEERTVMKEEVLVDDSYVCQFCGHALGSYVELRTHMKLHAHQKVTMPERCCDSKNIFG